MAMTRRGAGLFWGGEGWVLGSLIVDLLHVRCLLEHLGMSVGCWL